MGLLGGGFSRKGYFSIHVYKVFEIRNLKNILAVLDTSYFSLNFKIQNSIDYLRKINWFYYQTISAKEPLI